MSGPRLGQWYRRFLHESGDDVNDRHPGVESFRAYIAAVLPRYEFAPHLEDLISLLEAVERGDEDRVIIVWPPRHGKTWTCSHMFPGWFLGRHPDQEFIHVGHTERFARDKYGRRVRNIVGSAAYRDVFPTIELAKDSQAADLWHTNSDGVYVSAGIGSAIAGRGGDMVLIDDPVRKSEDADSEVMREKCWDWYIGDLQSRLHPGARIVVISTRWHEDDLVGRLLRAQREDEDADKWTVLHKPALTDDGKALWPTRADGSPRYDERWARKKRAIVTPRKWEAQYQGRPRPAQGLYFKDTWMRRGLKPERQDIRCYGLSDLARSQSRGDYTVHMVLGIDRVGRPWVMDRWSDRTSPDRWIAPMADMVQRWKPTMWLQEAGPIWSMTAPFMLAELNRRKIYVRIEAMPSVADKEERATSIQGYIAAHGLWIDRREPWAQELITNLLVFPVAVHDDDADCLSLAGRLGSRLTGPLITEVTKPPPGTVSFEELRLGTGYGAQQMADLE